MTSKEEKLPIWLKDGTNVRHMSQFLGTGGGGGDDVDVDALQSTVFKNMEISLQNRKSSFEFDGIFGNSSQPLIYQTIGKKIVDNMLNNGINGTILAYGQTGGGKTYTMEGQLGSPHRGIMPRCIEYLFEQIETRKNKSNDVNVNVEEVKVSYFEIYREELRDLLTPGANHSLKIRDVKSRQGNQSIVIENLSEISIDNSEDAMQLLSLGAGNRTVAGTNMNAVSSRSHSLFRVSCCFNEKNGGKRVGYLFFVDLSGSEKVSKTGASGQVTCFFHCFFRFFVLFFLLFVHFLLFSCFFTQ